MAGLSTIETRGFALSSRPVIAVDLGGTRIRAAVVLPDGSRVARNDRQTPKDEGPAAIVAACIDAAREYCAHRDQPKGPVTHVETRRARRRDRPR